MLTKSVDGARRCAAAFGTIVSVERAWMLIATFPIPTDRVKRNGIVCVCVMAANVTVIGDDDVLREFRIIPARKV